MNKTIVVLATVCFMTVTAWGGDQATSLVPGEGFVDVTGGKVWYRIVGSGEKTPLLILHGGPGFPSIYLTPLEALADDRPVIFYDQLGCGNSPGPSDTTLWTIERFVEEIAQVREALGLKEIHLYGHSWGTMIAVDYILTKPSGVRSLIVASPVFNLSRLAQDSEKLLNDLPDSVSEVIRWHDREGTLDSPECTTAIMLYMNTFAARKQPWSDDLDSAFAQANEVIGNYMMGTSWFTAGGTLSEFDLCDRLGEITTPTLLTAGQYDFCTPATVKYYQSIIPGSEIVILENCGHQTMHNDPETDVRIIREFLAKVESR